MKLLFLNKPLDWVPGLFDEIDLRSFRTVLGVSLVFFLQGGVAEDSSETENGTAENNHRAEPILSDQVPEVLPLLESFLESRSNRLTDLLEKYQAALETRFDLAADAGNLELATAFDEEKKRVAALAREFIEASSDPFDDASSFPTFPELPAGNTPEDLSAMRETWNRERSKILEELHASLDSSLLSIEAELTKERKLEEAKLVHSLRNGELPFMRAGMNAGEREHPTQESVGVNAVQPGQATKEEPFVNGLGMRFVPVRVHDGPSDGKLVLFSVWETRVKDYLAFVRENPQVEHLSPFPQEMDHPVLMTSWEEAVAFCDWLTKRDREEGLIDDSLSYRLPTDHEWSVAIGIGRKEDADASPREKNRALANIYPWGNDWPPRETVGNFYGLETVPNPLPNSIRKPIENYRDGFDRTSPVGSFESSEDGLYDLSGNAWEWCADWFSIAEEGKVLRGGSYESDRKEGFLSSSRIQLAPNARANNAGFRCVLSESVE